MKPEFQRVFETQPTIGGYEVVAVDTGRPVDERPTLQAANGVAWHLNKCATQGPKALAAALGATGR